MADAWTFSGESARVGALPGPVTLVEGSSFCLSDGAGDIHPHTPHGLFFLDTRFLSRFELRLDGQPVEGLGVSVDDPFAAVFFGRTHPPPGRTDGAVVWFRRRWVGTGLREEIELQNYAEDRRTVTVDLLVDADFADLFAVKESRVRRRGAYHSEVGDDFIAFSHHRESRVKSVRIDLSEAADTDSSSASWTVDLGPGARWTVCIGVSGGVDGQSLTPRFSCGAEPGRAAPEERLASWRRRVPVVDSDDPRLPRAVRRASEDLGALRIFDPDHPETPVIAAGAPWFMTLFGRDSLLTAWMALVLDPDLARGVLETLARLQGTKVDDRTEEQPGRILHEVRFSSTGSMALGDGDIYYGTADATPLFVMLLGELRRWGLNEDIVSRLLPHADRALQWITDYGDRDGDGYVEYERLTPKGLANQGWKDSWDGIRYADGRVAHAPIALCEVQGYVYAAFVARAHFADEAGDQATSDHYRARARALKERFNRDFWLPDREWFAVGLDGDKNPIDSLTSNIGHCLWTGIVDEDKAEAVTHRLLTEPMFGGWGVRTLAADTPGFNPVSYHCGSVWPHDNAICAAGLMRYGFADAANRVMSALLDVSTAFDGRLPELFAGVARSRLQTPAPYPTSCVPQAWAAASPLLFLRTMLRLDPWVPHGTVHVAPVLPDGVHRLRVEGIPLSGARVTIEVNGDEVTVTGLPDGLELVREARTPLVAEHWSE
ncbi:MAG TPA: glycogen debranching N-terminal domain-containing protein [Acidimicrobiales bacterium]|nr:glycogen debranching N-terminal domain-containing protein [Acidimicrobiales bacterium]